MDDGQINKGFRSYFGSFAEGAITGAAFGLLGKGASLFTQSITAFGSGK